MQQLTQAKPSAALPRILLQLRQSMAGVDSSATATPSAALAKTLDSIPETQRNALLLHTLDEAIAAIELAAYLADALAAQHNTADSIPTAKQALDAMEQGGKNNRASDVVEDPLFAAYLAFTESQPTYQDLYHYRNALAERLRIASELDSIEA